MVMSVRPVDAALANLRAAILAGRPAPGQALPPERQLAGTLGVSRLTLRAAIARLESEGLVRARQGDAVRVLAPAQHANLGMLAHIDVHRDVAKVASFLELRRLLAVETVLKAASKLSTAGQTTLAALIERQRHEPALDAFTERDLEISRAIVVAADNFAMLLLFNSLAAVYRAQPALAAALHHDRKQAMRNYDALLAIVRHQGSAPNEALRAGLRTALEIADRAALRRLAKSRPSKSPS